MNKFLRTSVLTGIATAAGFSANAANFVIDDFSGSPDQFIFVNPFVDPDADSGSITYTAGSGGVFDATPSISVVNRSSFVSPTLLIGDLEGANAGDEASGNVAFGQFDSVDFKWSYVAKSGTVDMTPGLQTANALVIDLLELQGTLDISVTIKDTDSTFTLSDTRSDDNSDVLFTAANFIGIDFDEVTEIEVLFSATETTDFLLGSEFLTLTPVVPTPAAAGAGLFGLALIGTRRRR